MSKFLDLEAGVSSGDEVIMTSDSEPQVSQKHRGFRKAASRMRKLGRQLKKRKTRSQEIMESIDLTQNSDEDTKSSTPGRPLREAASEEKYERNPQEEAKVVEEVEQILGDEKMAMEVAEDELQNQAKECPKECPEVPPGNIEAGGTVAIEAKSGKKGSRSRYWVLTDMRPGIFDHTVLPKGMVYKVFQLEISPQTKKEHYQIYCEYDSTVRFAQVRKDHTYPDKKGSMYIAYKAPKATRQQARAYCMKAESRKAGEQPIEVGEWNEEGQGRRSDLKIIARKAIEGASFLELAEEAPHIMAQYGRGMERLISEKAQKDAKLRNVKVTVLVGQPGCGKDLLAQVMAKKLKYFLIVFRKDKEWWDGYKGEKGLIISEYKGQIEREAFLSLIDHGKQMVPIKGSMVLANWTDVFITSNLTPDCWYGEGDFLHKALMRRITVQLNFNPETKQFEEDMKHREIRNEMYESNPIEQRKCNQLVIKQNIPSWKKALGAVDRTADVFHREYLEDIEGDVVTF